MKMVKQHYALAIGTAGLLTLGAGSAHAAYVFQTITDPLNPTFTQTLGINDAGTIVGYGNATTFNGFELTLPSSFTRQNVTGADGGTQVIGISGTGTTVGFSVTGGVTSGFAQTGGTFTTVNGSGAAFTQLLGINKSGTIAAGYSSTDPAGATLQKALTVAGGPSFSSPVFTDINALLPLNLNSQATGVNDAGTTVGFYQYNATDFAAFQDIGGVISSFQALGSVSTQALGINNLGQIVGDYVDSGGTMHGFVDVGGLFTPLDPAGSGATTANGINDKGQIVGFYLSGTSTFGFLAQVPEPASLLVFATGLAALIGTRRRRSGSI